MFRLRVRVMFSAIMKRSLRILPGRSLPKRKASVEFIQSPCARRRRQLVRFKFNHAEAGWLQLFLVVPCGITCMSTQWHYPGSATSHTSTFWWFHTHCINLPWGERGGGGEWSHTHYVHTLVSCPPWLLDHPNLSVTSLLDTSPLRSYHLSCNHGRHLVRTSSTKLVSPSSCAILTILVTCAAYTWWHPIAFI